MLLAELRSRIADIVPSPLRSSPAVGTHVAIAIGPPAASGAPSSTASGVWDLGIPALDRLLPARGLSPGGLHEIVPVAPGDAASALLLGMILAGRFLRATCSSRPTMLWVQTPLEAREIGQPYGPGLAAAGLDPAALVLVAPRTSADALWAVEEGLRGGADLVLACLDTARARTVGRSASHPHQPDMTAQRRLRLAAAAGAAPCIVVSGPAAAGLAAAHTRWSVARTPSRCPSHWHESVAVGRDRREAAPGPPCLRIGLERCRQPGATAGQENARVTVEWCDETHRFRVPAALADRAAGSAGRRAAGVPPRGGTAFWRRAG